MADRDALAALVQSEGKNFTLAPWDWRYYAGKLRKARCDVDEAAIKPYFQLERIIEETDAEEKTLQKKSKEQQAKIEDRLLQAYHRIRGSYRNGLAVVTVTASVTAPTLSVIGTFKFCSVSKVTFVSDFA